MRFTTRDDTLYAIVLGRAGGDFRITNLTLKPNARVRLIEGGVTIPVKEGKFVLGRETDASGCCVAVDLADIV